MNLNEATILVTPTSFGKNDPAIKEYLESLVKNVIYNNTGKPLSGETLKDMLENVDGYIAGLDEINEIALSKANKLKVISRYGVGVDNVKFNITNAKNIVVTNTPGANSVSVAELALAMMLSLARDIPEAINAVREGKWPRFNGKSLEGKSIGIIGLGSIGKQLVKRLNGFDVTIYAYDPYPDQEMVKKYQVTYQDLDQLLPLSDFVSLHLPLNAETREMVNSEFFAKMKPGSFLINTARGEIINETDLLKAIQSGLLAGAALDAFSEEPPNKDNPLLKSKQVLLTPHMGAHADSATNNMAKIAMDDCIAVLSGKTPKYPVIYS